jgi:predicted adenylyl cyclase CyaB
MARNVEIKAAVADFTRVTAALARLSAGPGESLLQEDTFFRCARGRLKLRRFSATAGQLIYYERPDQAGPKTSEYTLAPTAEPERLRAVLAAAHGVLAVVRKQRTARMVGRTRVHLDEVEDLGRFVELEVVLQDGEPAERGVAEARDLMTTLGIEEDQLVSHAYVDLLLAAAPR